MDNNCIILIFGGTEKKSKFPNDIEDLRNNFLKEFGLEKIENYSFYYGVDNLEAEIDENSFDTWKSDSDNLKNNIIKVKDKSNNLTQSSMYNFPQTRQSQLFEIQNTVIINLNKKEDSNEKNNKNTIEIDGNINSEQCLFNNTKDYGGRDPPKTLKELEKQIDNNYNLNQNSQKNNDNNSSEIDNNNMNTEKIKVKTEENNKINNLNLEIKNLKGKNSKLENEIIKMKEEDTENKNTIRKLKEQIQNLSIKNKEKYFSDGKKDDNEILILKVKINCLQKEKKQLKNEKDETIKKFDELNEKYNNLIKENDALNNKINELNEKYNNLIKENDELNNIINKSNKKHNNLTKENDELNNKINELIKENQNYKEQITKIENSKYKTSHDNIECNKCNALPIKGYRYICLNCNHYNLCEQCFEINLDSPFHEHSFYRLKDKEIIQQFRMKYNTPIKYKDEAITKALVQTRGNLEDSFFKLYIDN